MNAMNQAQTAYDAMEQPDNHMLEPDDEDRYSALAASWVENGGDVAGARMFDVGDFVGWVIAEQAARGIYGKNKRTTRQSTDCSHV